MCVCVSMCAFSKGYDTDSVDFLKNVLRENEELLEEVGKKKRKKNLSKVSLMVWCGAQTHPFWEMVFPMVHCPNGQAVLFCLQYPV